MTIDNEKQHIVIEINLGSAWTDAYKFFNAPV